MHRSVESMFVHLVYAMMLLTATSTGFVIRHASAQETKPVTASGGQVVDIQAQVNLSLKRLDADTLAERDQAEKDILQLGPAALEFLPKVTASTASEMRVRLERLTEKLQSERYKISMDESKVTLKGEFTIREAIDKITEQTGNRFITTRLPDKRVDLDLDGVAFWEAVDELLDACDLDIQFTGNDENGLTLIERSPETPLRLDRGSSAGIFRLEPAELVASRSLNNPSMSSLTIVASVTWEPRLEPIFLQFPMKTFKLVAGDKTYVATQPEASPEYSPIAKSLQMEVEWETELPDREIRMLDSIEGEFIAAVPSERSKIMFGKLDQPAKQNQTVGNLTVSVERVRKHSKVYEVTTSIRMTNAGQTMESYRGWLMSNEAYILDDGDRRIENVGWHTVRMSGNEVDLSYSFELSKGIENYRFVYEAPGVVSQQTIPFKLKNIALP